MPLTHVCVWDSKIGYRRITVEKANELYPYEVSARGSQFVCELCAQNVGFSKARVDTGTRYFFHSSAEQNKECEDRQIPICLFNPQKPLIFQGFTPVFHSNLICLPLFLPLRAETRAIFYSPPTTLSSSLAEVRFASLVE